MLLWFGGLNLFTLSTFAAGVMFKAMPGWIDRVSGKRSPFRGTEIKKIETASINTDRVSYLLLAISMLCMTYASVIVPHEYWPWLLSCAVVFALAALSFQGFSLHLRTKAKRELR